MLSSEEPMWFIGKTRGFVVRPDLSHHSSGLRKLFILSELVFPLKMRMVLISTLEISFEAQLK